MIIDIEYIGATRTKCSVRLIWRLPLVKDIQVKKIKYTVDIRAFQIMATYSLNCMFLCLGNSYSSVQLPLIVATDVTAAVLAINENNTLTITILYFFLIN